VSKYVTVKDPIGYIGFGWIFFGPEEDDAEERFRLDTTNIKSPNI
jgi:hypothetical protein